MHQQQRADGRGREGSAEAAIGPSMAAAERRDRLFCSQSVGLPVRRSGRLEEAEKQEVMFRDVEEKGGETLGLACMRTGKLGSWNMGAAYAGSDENTHGRRDIAFHSFLKRV